MSSATTLFRLLNPIMMVVLKSPLHSIVSNQIMIITFTGRKSGKEYSIPISYYQEERTVCCFTHAGWWVNIGEGSVILLRIQGNEYQGIAKAFPEDTDLQAEYLRKMLKALPSNAFAYNVSLDENGDPDEEQVRQAVMTTVMIKTEINE